MSQGRIQSLGQSMDLENISRRQIQCYIWKAYFLSTWAGSFLTKSQQVKIQISWITFPYKGVFPGLLFRRKSNWGLPALVNVPLGGGLLGSIDWKGFFFWSSSEFESGGGICDDANDFSGLAKAGRGTKRAPRTKVLRSRERSCGILS